MLHFATDQLYLYRLDFEQCWKSYIWPIDAPDERLRVTTQVAQLLYDWPTHFYTFLDLQYVRSGSRLGTQETKELPVVEQALRAPQLQPIREDYHTYVG